jgi:hypothetical protein
VRYNPGYESAPFDPDEYNPPGELYGKSRWCRGIKTTSPEA